MPTLEQKYGRQRWGEGNEQNVIVPWVKKQKAGGDGKNPHRFNRYYYLDQEEELDDDIIQAGGIVNRSKYEKDS